MAMTLEDLGWNAAFATEFAPYMGGWKPRWCRIQITYGLLAMGRREVTMAKFTTSRRRDAELARGGPGWRWKLGGADGETMIRAR